MRSQPWWVANSNGLIHGSGVLVTNPPWGRRLKPDKNKKKDEKVNEVAPRGESGRKEGARVKSFRALYQTLGFYFSKLKLATPLNGGDGGSGGGGVDGWSASVLAHDVKMARVSGIPFQGASFRYNLRCLYYFCFLDQSLL